MSRCRWVYDREVPGGRYLVPGCMNRAVHDDEAECHCEGGELTVQEEVQTLRADLAALRSEVLRGLEIDRTGQGHHTKENTKESRGLRKRQPDLLIPETRQAPQQTGFDL